jgi:hypothetical protein
MQTRREHVYECQECGYTVKITVTSNGLVIVGLELQGIAILVGCLSAYSIWRTLKETSLANQASVSESLASQSIEILKYIADDPQLYEYFYKNKPLAVETPTHTKVLCCAEIMANFLEHIFLQRPSLPVASQEAWMRYVRDHYSAPCCQGLRYRTPSLVCRSLPEFRGYGARPNQESDVIRQSFEKRRRWRREPTENVPHWRRIATLADRRSGSGRKRCELRAYPGGLYGCVGNRSCPR